MRFKLQNQARFQPLELQRNMQNLEVPPNSTGAVIDSNLLSGGVRVISSIGSPTVEGQVATVDTANQLNVTKQPSATWSVVSTPAAASVASASKAAGGGTVKHVATSISFSAAVGASPQLFNVVLRDGATGVGTIVMEYTISIAASGPLALFALSGLKVIGSANTAMTLEFTNNGVSGAVQSVSLTGYDLPS